MLPRVGGRSEPANDLTYVAVAIGWSVCLSPISARSLINIMKGQVAYGAHDSLM